jgi:iron complex outermembrane receptor protein
MAAAVCTLPCAAAAQSTDELKRLTLEELLDTKITTVSRMPERAAELPAAVHVITQHDIRRSGATTIPEALRLVPGLHVAQIDSARWAIGIRGFADRLARAMLVLIDGRAVYSPLFAGTYWEVQDTLLADVERIEIVRGPGGTLWGANAVTGIVNIVTKSAAATSGLLVDADAGSRGYGSGSVRYGGTLGSRGAYRVFVKTFHRGAQPSTAATAFDEWHVTRAGGRADWTRANGHTFTVDGDAYGGRLGQRAAVTTLEPPYQDVFANDAPIGGGHALFRWSGSTPARDFQIQTYFDRTRRDEIPVSETRHTFDIDVQRTERRFARQAISWGAGYRVTSDVLRTVPPTVFTPEDRTDQVFSAFVHDEIALASTLRVSAGSKFEHNDYSGFEVQPSGRVMWSPATAHTLVGSLTRAVRTPSRVETDYSTASPVASTGLPTFVRLQPNPDFVSERLTALEAGYRVRVHPALYVTASSFYNWHHDQLSTDLLTPVIETAPPPVRLILPVRFGNTLRGRSYGGELTADWRPWQGLRVTGHYANLRIEMQRDPDSSDVSQERRYEGGSPRHQAALNASVDVTDEVMVDWHFRYVGELRSGPVPAYATSDLRLGWIAARGVELELVGRNLHEARHIEWAGSTSEIARSVYAGVTWRR